MTDPTLYVTVSVASLAGLAMLTAATLSGWREWLQLKNRQLDHGGGGPAMTASTAGARIEMADLKERIRKLEAIAAGVDL